MFFGGGMGGMSGMGGGMGGMPGMKTRMGPKRQQQNNGQQGNS